MAQRAGYDFDSRRPSLMSFPGDRAVVWLEKKIGTAHKPLAPAPPGLEPVIGRHGLPVLGNFVSMLRAPEQTALDTYQEFGGITWMGMFGKRVAWVVTPEAAQQVLANKDKVFSQTGWEFFIGPFFNRGLMLLDGEEHHLHRRIMHEAFTRPRLEGYLTQINEMVDAAVPTWPTDEPMRLFPAVKQLSLDVAVHVFMGAEVGRDADHLTDAFVDTVRAGAGIIRRRVPGMPWLAFNKGLAGRKVLDDYFRSRIAAKRASDDTDLFAVLTQIETDDGHSFSDDDVVNHMIFLMMAAHDTSTITASATAYYLAKNPEWQERCREESMMLGDGPVDLGALEKLVSLDLVFREALRLVAPVPWLMRRTLADTEVQGKYVPKDTLLMVLPSVTHILPDRWSEPLEFQPDRFAEPRHEEKGHRFQEIPFGGGAHKCIGMNFGTAEVKTLIHRLLLEYRLEVPPGYEVVWDHTALAVPTDGMPVTLRRL